MNEETMVDYNDVTQIPVNEEMDPKSPDDNLGAGWQVEPEKKKFKLKLPKDFSKKAAAIGGGIAGAVGLGTTIFELIQPVQAFPNESGELENPEDAEPAPEVSSDEIHVEPHDMDVATSVDDDMSFGEAFAAARHEVGAGGLFVWHGHTYGTYYANEWNALSPEDQQQYWSNVHHTVSQIEIEPEEFEVAEAEVEVVEAEPVTESDIISGDVEVVEVETEPIPEGELVTADVEVVVSEITPEAAIEVEVEAEPIDFSEEPIDIVDDVPQVDDDFSGVNLDVDDMAIIDIDPDIPIDNDMDMNDFV